MQDVGIKEKIAAAYGKAAELFDGYIGRYIELPKDRKKPDASEIKEAVVRGLTGIASGILFAFARIRGERPFGLALLAASAEKTPFVLAGAVISELIIGGDALIRVLSYGICFMLRVIMAKVLDGGTKKTYFTEPIGFRMAIGVTGAFITGIYGVISAGMTKTALYSMLTLIVAVPIITYIYDGCMGDVARNTKRYDIGIIAVVATLVASADALTSLGLVAAVFVTLCAAESGGGLKGCTVGTVCGLACGVNRSAMLGIGGLVAGCLKGSGTVLPMLSVCGTGMAYSFITEGLGCFGGTVPELLWGSAIYAPASKFGIVGRFPIISSVFPQERAEGERTPREKINERQRSDTDKRIGELSGALSSLSEVFKALSEKTAKPGIREVREICEKTLMEYCSACAGAGICRGREYERTAEAVNRISAALVKRGAATERDVPVGFASNCEKSGVIVPEINLIYARMLEKAAKENRTEVFAFDYAAMSKLIDETRATAAEEYEKDAENTRKAREAANSAGFYPVEIAVYGNREKKLIASGGGVSAPKPTPEEIRETMSTACGIEFTVPEYEVDGRDVTMTMKAARKLGCESAKAVMTKENEDVSGDSTSVFTDGNDRYYVIVSDGMGSGRNAAVTSKITSVFLEKMLLCGCSKGAALKMLNNIIRSRNSECFATVDLLEIDLLNGKAGFTKSGAAPSYILRSGKLFKIASNTLPIGITREINAEMISFELIPGDVVVMISDGIAQSFEDGMWLVDMLSFDVNPESPLEKTAEEILNRAKEKNTRSDDMTVVLTRVKSA